MSSSPMPRARRASRPARIRSSCGRLVATRSEPPLTHPQSMPSSATTRPTYVDRVDHRPLGADHALVAAPAAVHAGLARDARRHEPGVAPGGAVAGDLGLHQHDPQRRIGAGEAVRRPQPDEPAAHHGHVAVDGALEPRVRLDRLSERVQPQAPPAPARLLLPPPRRRPPCSRPLRPRDQRQLRAEDRARRRGGCRSAAARRARPRDRRARAGRGPRGRRRRCRRRGPRRAACRRRPTRSRPPASRARA